MFTEVYLFYPVNYQYFDTLVVFRMGCKENEEAAGSCCSGGSCSAGQPKKGNIVNTTCVMYVCNNVLLLYVCYVNHRNFNFIVLTLIITLDVKNVSKTFRVHGG